MLALMVAANERNQSNAGHFECRPTVIKSDDNQPVTPQNHD